MRDTNDQFKSYAERLDSCGAQSSTFYCSECSRSHDVPTFCMNKICSNYLCRAKRQKRGAAALLRRVRRPKNRTLKLITLTWGLTEDVQGTKQRFRAALKSLFRHFKGASHPVEWWLGVFELVFKGRGQFYLHMHVVADVEYLPQKKLSELWERRTGYAVVDIRAINSKGAIDYLAKYLGKGLKYEASDAFFPMLLYSFVHLRRLRMYSTSLDTKGISGTRSPRLCPFCGSDRLSNLTRIHAEVAFFLKRPPPPREGELIAWMKETARTA